MNRAILTIAFASLLCGCSNKEDQVPSQYDMSAVRANLAFTCVHEAEHLPPLDPQADVLFKYGRYLEKQNGPKDFNEVARYYRIAAAHGHYKANSNLQQLVSQGSASSPYPAKETVDLAEQLIKAGVPGGYYDMGHYLELGYVAQPEKGGGLARGRGLAQTRPGSSRFELKSQHCAASRAISALSECGCSARCSATYETGGSAGRV
jgi:TPR repeat protein